MMRSLFSKAVLVTLMAPGLLAQGPDLRWFNVPVTSGETAYTCMTRPDALQLAVITCNDTFDLLPATAQTFLLAHEHGHVLQIVRGGVQFAPNPEADADCYAAKTLAIADPGALAGAIWWLENVLGPRGGDAIHGTGTQVGALARQCAAQMGVSVP